MTEIIPGIHRFELTAKGMIFTLTRVNAYLVQGDSGYLLVDAGWNTDETLNALKRHLAEIGADIKDITQIVVTHVHPDHYGLAGRIKQLSGATLITHEIEREFIASRYVNMDKLLEETARWLSNNGVPSDELTILKEATMGLQQYVVPIYPDVTLHGGETITAGDFTFQVLWTPGHSPGHICLYEPEKKVLFSGDQVLPTITPNVSRHSQSGENPLGRFLDSLNALKRLDARIVLPGHEAPFSGLQSRIDELISHHSARNREILAALNGETKTAYQVAREITWGNGNSWHSLLPFDQRLAVFETLAHLEFMTVNGQLGKLSRDSVMYYRKT